MGSILKTILIGLIGTVVAYAAAVAIKSLEHPPVVGFDFHSTGVAVIALFFTWLIIQAK